MATNDNYQGELQGLLMGRGTNYLYDKPGVEGLFSVPNAKTADVDLGLDAGVALGGDWPGARLISWPVKIAETTDASSFSLIDELIDAWTPPDDPTEMVDFVMRFGGQLHTVTGRPRGLDEVDVSTLRYGVGRWVGDFFVPDGVVTVTTP